MGRDGGEGRGEGERGEATYACRAKDFQAPRTALLLADVNMVVVEVLVWWLCCVYVIGEGRGVCWSSKQEDALRGERLMMMTLDDSSCNCCIGCICPPTRTHTLLPHQRHTSRGARLRAVPC